MTYYFSWHDIETVFEQHYLDWPSSWIDVKVYSDSILIYHTLEEAAEQDTSYLKKIFGRNYIQEKNQLFVDFSQTYLDIIFETEEGEKLKKNYAPLFKDIYFQHGKMNQKGTLPGSRIIAFHSYKGGVGRTLSLAAFLRQYSENYPDKKILVIDADVEAPGLTWMTGETHRRISYLDILSVMNYENQTEQIINTLADLIKTSTISVATDKRNIEQYFVPVYREKEQIMNISSKPEQVLLTQANKFFITETLSSIGKALGAELVLVDLRTGITEYSAPFLFDARVEKYYVTSTSMQSIKGIHQILEQIYQKTDSDLLNSKILLTMIPREMKQNQIYEIENQILDTLESGIDTETSTFLRENYFLEVKFDDDFIHIQDLSSLCETLKGRTLTQLMDKQVQELFPSEKNEKKPFKEKEVRQILQKLYQIAKAEITAEGNTSANMLVTSSIKEMSKNFERELPNIVVSGAKGSGKTYLYKQLVQAKTWEKFIELTGGNEKTETTTILIPLLASINDDDKMRKLILSCMESASQCLDEIQFKQNAVTENYNFLLKSLESQQFTRSEWMEQWEKTMLATAGGHYEQLSDLDQALLEKQKRIVFLVDGLEDLCTDSMQIAKDDKWKLVLRALCQGVIRKLKELDYGNIGIIVFARRDMLNSAIETNTEQFRSLYRNYELNWTQTEALRLALWIAAKAYPDLISGMDVLTATKPVLIERLTGLWGSKLGRSNSKEAYSDRWILAALSDFTGQLQARDIVRFLCYASESYQDTTLIYSDRLLMPVDIRNAIKPCSEQKFEEIKTEMRNIYEILEKFRKMEGAKTLPLTLNKIDLTADEISKLEAQGYLKISDKKYYLPEIIRLGLGFTYEKGARPKVLALLVQ